MTLLDVAVRMLSNMYLLDLIKYGNCFRNLKESICSTMYLFQIHNNLVRLNLIFQTYPSEYHWWVEAVQIVDY